MTQSGYNHAHWNPNYLGVFIPPANQAATSAGQNAYQEGSLHQIHNAMQTVHDCVNPKDLTNDSGFFPGDFTSVEDNGAAYADADYNDTLAPHVRPEQVPTEPVPTGQMLLSDLSRVTHNAAQSCSPNAYPQSFACAEGAVQVPRNQDTSTVSALPEREDMFQAKRSLNSANITEEGNDRPRRRKRQKIRSQKSPASPADYEFVRALLIVKFKGRQPEQIHPWEVHLQMLQDFTKATGKKPCDVFRLVNSILRVNEAIQPETSVTCPPAQESEIDLAQRYADQAFTNRKCERPKKRMGSKGRYQCILEGCDYQTEQVDALKRHLDVRRPSTVYMCAICQSDPTAKSFMHHRKDKFRGHLKSDHQLTKYALKDTEKRLVFQPTAAKRTHCGFCQSNGFSTNLDFRDHVITHFKDGRGGGVEWNAGQDWREELQHETDSRELQSGAFNDDSDDDNDDDSQGSESNDDGSHHDGNDGNDDDDDDDGYNDNTGSRPDSGSSGGPDDTYKDPSGGSNDKSPRNKGGNSRGHFSASYPGLQNSCCHSLNTERPESASWNCWTTLVNPSFPAKNPLVLIKPLGRGASGSVDKVQASSNRMMYARKSIVMTKRGAGAKISFDRETMILKTRSHRNIPRLISTYVHGSTLNLLMEPAADINLREYLGGGNSVGQKTMLVWCEELASALMALHAPDSNDVCVRHGDIKPSNIVVIPRNTTMEGESSVMIIDFGASRFVSAKQSKSSSNCAMTRMYAAPEILSDGKHGRKADIFSLACVFVELVSKEVTGSLDELMSRLRLSPTESQHNAPSASYSERIQELMDWVDELRQRAGQNYSSFFEICKSMLAVHPSQRPTASTIWESLAPGKFFSEYISEPCTYPLLAHGLGLGKEENRKVDEDSGSGSDDELLLPERTPSTPETDEAIRKKVVQQNSDFGQDPRERALRPLSNLESLQSPQVDISPLRNPKLAMVRAPKPTVVTKSFDSQWDGSYDHSDWSSASGISAPSEASSAISGAFTLPGIAYESSPTTSTNVLTASLDSDIIHTSSNIPWKSSEQLITARSDCIDNANWSEVLFTHGPSGTRLDVLKDENEVQLRNEARNLRQCILMSGKGTPPGSQQTKAELGTNDEGEAGEGVVCYQSSCSRNSLHTLSNQRLNLLLDNVSTDLSAPSSDEEKAIEGWHELGAASTFPAWSAGSHLQCTNISSLLQSPKRLSVAIDAALTLFANTNFTVRQSMSLPHLFAHNIHEVRVELQALENMLSQLSAVFQDQDEEARHLDLVRRVVFTEIGLCLKTVFWLRKVIIKNDKTTEEKSRLKLRRTSDIDMIVSCKEKIHDSNRVLARMRRYYHFEAFQAVIGNFVGKSDVEYEDDRTRRLRESLPGLFLAGESRSPSYPSSGEIQLSPTDKDFDEAPYAFDHTSASPLPSINQALSRSPRVSIASSIASYDRSSISSRASFASSTSSISSAVHLPQRLPPPPKEISVETNVVNPGPQETLLLCYCASSSLPEPLWRIESDGASGGSMVKVKAQGQVTAQSHWHQDVRRAREEAAEFLLEELAWMSQIPNQQDHRLLERALQGDGEKKHW
ncbi:MAG: hypothetical protein M1822_008458 [Bathelium mastoideum]|nr:MAG: hypothetical protein M1822_008458 [Bathelium mastoideum]